MPLTNFVGRLQSPYLKVLARAIRHEKIKGTQIDQADIKLSLVTDDILLSTENAMESTQIELHSLVHLSLLKFLLS